MRGGRRGGHREATSPAAVVSGDPSGCERATFPGSGTPPNSSGDSEPAIAFGNDSKMVIDGLAWIPFQLNVWTGAFGASSTYTRADGSVHKLPEIVLAYEQ